MKLNKQNLLKLAEDLVKYAKQKGADQAQIHIGDSTDFSVEVRNQNIEKLTEASARGLSIKVILDNKVATASSSDMSMDTLKKLIDNAITRAKLSSKDEFSGIPELEKIEVDIDSLKLFDPQILEVAADEKIRIAKKLEEIALKDSRIKISNGSFFSSGFGATILANSNGFAGYYEQTSVATGVYLQAGEKDNMYEDGWYDVSLNWAGLKSVEDIAKKAVNNTTRMIGARKIPTALMPVIFEANIAASLFGFLAGCLSGSSIYMKQSFLTGKINTKIANEKVNIYDNGLIPGLIGTQPFDGEGVPIRNKTIVENGILKNYFLDTYSGKKLNMKSNGSASGVTNFYLEKGTHTPEQIIKSIDKGLYITSTIGQGTVPTTGDISKGAFGLMIEKGELTYPVHEVTFSGNLETMLNDIEMIGNDLNFRSSVNSPTIKIKSLSIAGQ